MDLPLWRELQTKIEEKEEEIRQELRVEGKTLETPIVVFCNNQIRDLREQQKALIGNFYFILFYFIHLF